MFKAKKQEKKQEQEKKENRYEEAKRNHFNMYMNQSKAIHTWKLFTFIMSFFFLISFATSVYLSMRTSLIPYIIEVDQFGVPKVIGEIDKIKYSPKEAEYSFFVREFITRARAIPKDKVLYNSNYKKNMYFLKEESISKYNTMINDMEATRKLEENHAVEINIVSCQKVANTENTYQIRWEEKEYDGNGFSVVSGIKRLSCIMVITEEKLKKLEEIAINPLGLKIIDFNLTKEN